MPRSFEALVQEACRELHLGYRALGQLCGLGLRTVQRHHGLPGPMYAAPLIRSLHAVNPAMARELATASFTSLELLGIEAPAAAATPAPSTAEPGEGGTLRLHAESVLLAAADAMQLPPGAVRPAVAAALGRAAELGADPKALAGQLSRPGSRAAGGARAKRAG